MREIDERAVAAANDEIVLDDFIREFEPFIIKTTAKIAGKFITKADEEWSIGLNAFMQAVFDYSYEKGAFLGFAHLVIKRRYIDYLRTRKNILSEVLVDPGLFGDGEPEEGMLFVKNEISEKTAANMDGQNEIQYEIESLQEVFKRYGFSFLDLASCSPKSKKTKFACAKAVQYILNMPIVYRQMKDSKMLPIKIIQNETDVPRKVIENHRKYIIAAVEILSGEYPYLAEYMRFIREVT